MAEPGVELQPEQAPIIQENNLTVAPPDTSREIYQNEFGRLVAPTTGQQVRDENMHLARHFGLFNTWDERDSEQGGGGGLISRQIRYAQMNSELDKAGAKKLTLEETQKIYPAATEPMHQQYAEMLANQQRLVNGRREYAARGGDIWWITHFGQEAWRTLTEPSELALMAATGGVSKAFGVANTVRSVFFANLVQNLAVEGASYSELKAEGENPTVLGSLSNAVVGAGVGTGVHFGGQYLAKKLAAKLKERAAKPAAPNEKAPPPPPPPPGEKGPAGPATPPPPPSDAPPSLPKEAHAPEIPMHPLPDVPHDIEMARFLTSIAQHEAGRNINPNFGDDLIRARKLGVPVPGSTQEQHVFRPFTDGTDRHYFMSGAEGEAFSTTGLGGEHAADMLDNGHATNMNGQLAEMRLREKANLIDIDQRGTELPNVLDVIGKRVLERLTAVMTPAEHAKLEGKLLFPTEATLKDILENVKYQTPEALGDIASDLQKMGIDGYRYVTVDHEGTPVHNGMILFDKNKAEMVGHYDQNPDMIPKVTPEMVNEAIDNPNQSESSPFYEPGVTEKPPEKIDVPLEYDADPDAFNKSVSQDSRTQASEHERALKQMVEANPEIADEIAKETAAIDKEYDASKQRAKALGMLADCFGKEL